MGKVVDLDAVSKGDAEESGKLTSETQVGKRWEQFYNLPNLGVLASLAVALVIISFMPVFLKWSEREISPYAASFNRLWIASILFLSVEQLRSKLSTTTVAFWSSAFGSLFTLPILWLTPDRVFPYSWHGWLALISLAAIGQVLGDGLLTYSLNRLSSGFVALSLLPDVILGGIFGWLFFSEKLSYVDWVAIVLVLLGLCLAISSNSATKS